MNRIFQRFLKSIREFLPPNIASKLKPRGFDRELFTVSGKMGTVNLFALALPMLLENVTSHLIGFINSAVLSGYSEAAVAATGSASTVINLLSLLLTVLSIGTGVVVSNFIGANDEEGTRKTSFVAVTVCGSIGILLSVLTALSADLIMQLMNLEGETLRQASVYFKIRSAFFFVPMISGMINTLLRCYGHAGLTVVTGFLTIFCNLLLNVWVIHFPQYSPLTGVEGIAAGGVISQCIGLFSAILFAIRKKLAFQRPDSLSQGLDYAKKILRIGVPSGLSAGAYSLSQVITASFVALLGDHAVSARVYYNNILSYAYLFSLSFGSANSLLVGRLMGAGKIEHAKRLTQRLSQLTCSVNLLLSLTIILLRIPLLSIFTDSAAILQASLAIFLIDLVAEQARGVSQVYEYALRGVGDMKFMMVVVVCSCWVFGVGLSYFLGISCGMGLIGCWIGMTLDECTRAVASYYRWKKQSRNQIHI